MMKSLRSVISELQETQRNLASEDRESIILAKVIRTLCEANSKFEEEVSNIAAEAYQSGYNCGILDSYELNDRNA